jgi:hypothetical protein
MNSRFGRSRKFIQALSLFVVLGATNAHGQTSQQPKSNPADTKPTFVLKQFSAEAPIRLIAYGDMRFCDPAITTGTNPKVRRWLAEKIGQERPQALLLTGDMPYIGERKADWEEFQRETASWHTDGFPVFPTMGNHEVYHNLYRGVSNYLDNFPGIERHRYYTALLGSIEVMALDMNQPVGPRSDQGQWIAAQLDHIPRQVEFLMILYHIPWVADTQSQLVASLPSKDALTLRTMLEERLAGIHAKVLVFSGHIHNYERFERQGMEYVVTGGGGAEPYPILYRGNDDLYRDTAFPVFNYVTIEVRDHQLQAVMWKVSNPEEPDAAKLNVEAKDRFTIKANQRATPKKP